MEDVEVGEVHRGEAHQEPTHLGRQGLDRVGERGGVPTAHQQARIAEVDEVEAHHQQLVDRFAERRVVDEDVLEQQLPIARERAREEHGERNAEEGVHGINEGHGTSLI